jgi:hypothetical protein
MPAGFLLVVSAMVYILPSIWGAITSIGLFRVANWARISIIVFSVLLIGIGVFAAPFSFFLSWLGPATPNAPSIGLFVGVVMGLFWLGILGIGVWWLVFFTRARVKAQFTGVLPPTGTLSPATSIAQTVGGPPATLQLSRTERPISLTVIAWFALAGSVCLIPMMFTHLPAVFFIKTLTGWPAIALYLAFAVVSFYVGLGLLRYKPFAREIGIGYFLFTVINMVVFYLTPGSRLRIQTILDDENKIFPWMTQGQTAATFRMDPTPMMIFGAAMAVILAGVQIYFLITRKEAYEQAAAASKGV